MKSVIKKAMRAFAMQNAVKFGGKATPGAVLGKIFGQYPDEKKNAQEIQKEIQQTIQEVNTMTLAQQEAELIALTEELPELLDVKERDQKQLKPLENAEQGKVVMRFEPSPSGPLHVGHAYALMLNYLYCKKYNGKIILRIADTNPDNIDKNAYQMIEQDFKWLCSDLKYGCYVQSDRMEMYYEWALKLLEEGYAYACTCEQEEFRTKAQQMVDCPCRKLGKEERLKRWHRMLITPEEGKPGEEGYEQGDIAIRLKTDMHHKNPAMRDFPLLRINDEPHPRQGKKYRVWPLLNFAVAVDDHEMGMTHVLRGKDHYDNTKRQEYIFNYLKWKMPEYIHVGRINFEGLRLKTTETRHAIAEGKFTGWDDVRLPFIRALKRRGYQPPAFAKYAESVGVTMVDKKVNATEFFKAINAFNKEVIDEKTDRLFFIHDPVAVTIHTAPECRVELDKHPEKRKGGRVFKTKEDFFLAKTDYDIIQNSTEKDIIRLMDCLNFVKKGNRLVFHSLDYDTYKQSGKLIIHWLPKEQEVVEVEMLMPDASRMTGVGESRVNDLKVGDIIQFERTGFCRLDEKQGKRYSFVFLHR